VAENPACLNMRLRNKCPSGASFSADACKVVGDLNVVTSGFGTVVVSGLFAYPRLCLGDRYQCQKRQFLGEYYANCRPPGKLRVYFVKVTQARDTTSHQVRYARVYRRRLPYAFFSGPCGSWLNSATKPPPSRWRQFVLLRKRKKRPKKSSGGI
jgi:hypothetical protein